MTVEFEDAKQLTELTSNDTLKSLFGKLKLTVRDIIKHGKLLGDTNIAEIGDGMVTGAIHAQYSTVSQCLKSGSDGKSAVASAITAQGVTTAANATFNTMASNITTLSANRYNAGVTAADGRANPGSANYKAGYAAGISTGGAGKYTVKSGSVTRTQSSGNTWKTETIYTGLTSVAGAMARVVGDYGIQSGNGYLMDSASGGNVTFKGIGFNGPVTIYWMAYGN